MARSYILFRLDKIIETLNRMETNMSSQEQELDSILAAIKDGQAENVAAFDETEAGVARLIELVSTPGVDLSDENAEFAQVRDGLLASVARVKATNDTITAALPAPPA